MRDKKKYMQEYRQRHADEIKAKKREYQQRPEVKEKQRERMREYQQRPDVKERRKVNKIDNVDNIRAICLEHGFSEEAADAIAIDGELLDKKLREAANNTASI